MEVTNPVSMRTITSSREKSAVYSVEGIVTRKEGRKEGRKDGFSLLQS
jgi:hypothetical protein